MINEEASFVKTLFTLSKINNIDEAINDLKEREGTTLKNLGHYIKENDIFYSEDFSFQNNIKDWINNIDLDAIIWTNLKDVF